MEQKGFGGWAVVEPALVGLVGWLVQADLLSLIKPVKRGLTATDVEKSSIDVAASLYARAALTPIEVSAGGRDALLLSKHCRKTQVEGQSGGSYQVHSHATPGTQSNRCRLSSMAAPLTRVVARVKSGWSASTPTRRHWRRRSSTGSGGWFTQLQAAFWAPPRTQRSGRPGE